MRLVVIAFLTLLRISAMAASVRVDTVTSGPQWNIDVTADAYPSPASLIPVLDTNGIVVGTVRQVMYAGDTNVYYLTDTASPQKPWKVQLRQFVRLIERRERAEARAKEKRPGETIEATRTNLLAAIETSTGKKQQDAIVRYLEWLTLELQTVRGEE